MPSDKHLQIHLTDQRDAGSVIIIFTTYRIRIILQNAMEMLSFDVTRRAIFGHALAAAEPVWTILTGNNGIGLTKNIFALKQIKHIVRTSWIYNADFQPKATIRHPSPKSPDIPIEYKFVKAAGQVVSAQSPVSGVF